MKPGTISFKLNSGKFYENFYPFKDGAQKIRRWALKYEGINFYDNHLQRMGKNLQKNFSYQGNLYLDIFEPECIYLPVKNQKLYSDFL